MISHILKDTISLASAPSTDNEIKRDAVLKYSVPIKITRMQIELTHSSLQVL